MAEAKRVRLDPRMSNHKLGSYVDEASPRERRRIIRDQKFLSPFIVTVYKRAEELISRALIAGGDIRAALAKADQQLAQMPFGGANGERNRRCNRKAVASFVTTLKQLDISGAEFWRYDRQGFALRIEGVKVSVSPSVGIRVERKGRVHTGAVQLVFRQEEQLSPHGGSVVAELLRQSLVERSAGTRSEEVSRDLCIVCDVFHGQVFQAPSRSVTLNRDIAAACREIRMNWPSVLQQLAA